MDNMKKIMIIDDQDDIRFSIKDSLGLKNQFEFIEAKNKKECFSLIRRGDVPDLILLELMIPGNGWDIAADLKQNEKTMNTPLVMLTTETDKMKKSLGLICADDYIEKPFSVLSFNNKVSKLLK